MSLLHGHTHVFASIAMPTQLCGDPRPRVGMAGRKGSEVIRRRRVWFSLPHDLTPARSLIIPPSKAVGGKTRLTLIDGVSASACLATALAPALVL